MKLITPYSDLQQLELLEASLREIQSPNTAVSGFSPELVAELTANLPLFRANYEAFIQARESWKTKRQECQAQEQTLRYRIRDAFQVIKRELRNPAFPKSLFEAFGLLRNGNHSQQTQQLKVPIQIARRIVAAHASATAQGLEILIDPLPAELTTLADGLVVLKEELAAARNLERDAFVTLNASRETVQLLIGKVKANARLLTVGLNAQQKRETLQALGFSYRSNSQTPVDLDDADSQDDANAEPEPNDADPPEQQNDGDDVAEADIAA